MATTETFLGLRRPDRTDSTSVITDLDNNYTLIGAAFDPASAVAPQAPKALLRETALTTTYTTAANLINLQPVWNAPGATLRGLFVDVTHTGAGAASRPIEVRRGGNPIWDVDITTQNAVNGLSLQGGATGTAAVLKAIGVDATVGITITPKGGGTLTVVGPTVLQSSTGAALLTAKQLDANAAQITLQPINGTNNSRIRADWASGVGYLGLGAGANDQIKIDQAGTLILTTAASKIVPGVTSLSLRNNADTADNLLVSDAGLVTARLAFAGPGNVATGGAVRLAGGDMIRWRYGGGGALDNAGIGILLGVLTLGDGTGNVVTSSTATAGGIVIPTAAQFLTVSINGSTYKIPLCAN